MPSLADIQANFIATINEGPAALDASLFAGDPQRIMLGLRAHANTISHARLVALEETFPRTRSAMGDEAFNAASRSFIETADARARNNDALGEHFAAALRHNGQPADIADLAAVEWLWLQSYHAREAAPLALADLAGLDETALLALPVAPHPAAFAMKLSAPLSAELAELQDAGDAAAILITRPDSVPVLTPVGAIEADLAVLTRQPGQKNIPLGNLLALSAEQGGEDDALSPVITLINAGALSGPDES